jgi:hypothetical protein
VASGGGELESIADGRGSACKKEGERLTLAEETIFLCREVQQDYILVLVG